jgi:hypothetical protein
MGKVAPWFFGVGAGAGETEGSALTPSIGQLVRGMFGPYEHQISDAYRAIFFDIGDFVS